jgi:hypothetical protein
LRTTLGFEIPGLQACLVGFVGADLCLPVEGDPLAVTKPIDDRERSAVDAAGAVTDIDDEAVQTTEVCGNRIQSGSQLALLDAFQLENPDVANGARAAIVKHPGLGFSGPAKTIKDQSFFGRFKELLNLRLGKFLPESRLSLRIEISFLATQFGFQLDMSVVQWGEHLAKKIEEFVVTGLAGHFWPVSSILLVPIDFPQIKKWVSLVKGLP